MLRMCLTQTRATRMNDNSSRSHAVVRLYIESRQRRTAAVTAVNTSVINFVDLAGSEWAAQADAGGDAAEKLRHKEVSAHGRTLGQCLHAHDRPTHTSAHTCTPFVHASAHTCTPCDCVARTVHNVCAGWPHQQEPADAQHHRQGLGRQPGVKQGPRGARWQWLHQMQASCSQHTLRLLVRVQCRIGHLRRLRRLQRHLPYRDSKLTRLLQPHLAGNSHMAVITTISPSAGEPRFARMRSASPGTPPCRRQWRA
jgi:hypothetical protein